MYLADKNWGPDNMLCSQIVYKFVVEYDLTLVQFFLFLKKAFGAISKVNQKLVHFLRLNK